MMKLARVLKPGTSGRISARSDLMDVLCSNGFFNQVGISTIGQNVGANDRIHAQYYVYKGKAALSACPVLPRFTKLNNGALKVDRPGAMMLTFSPAVAERKYDWARKQLFALSVTEVGSLITLGTKDSCEFFHDPSIRTSAAGQVRKSLSVKPLMDCSGYFISLNVVNNALQTNERLTVPITSAEFAVMCTTFRFALPILMGWDRYNNSQPLLLNVGVTTAKLDASKLPKSIESEWDR
ncbi:hypothetical protein Nepgr_018539 [Nepenthes gracilis]|uniref:Single-stranded DNA-bindig protein WHY2, mitochondrial n=1 Tax=Nepenthes gracilis TaxID=150966 RepID=A0AAD3SRJ5_NEPGR|nr:hypothetical protein Nepgr_018539 [Nepenthes gracilis]